MDYLEEAKSGIEKLINPETEEIDSSAISVIAFALVAIAERLTAFGAGAAMRREIDKLAIEFEELGGRIDDLERSLTAAKLLLESVDGRTEGLPRAAGAMSARLTDVELTIMASINSQASRIDELERKLGTVGHFSVSERLADVEKRADDLESFLNKRTIRDREFEQLAIRVNEIEDKIDWSK